VTHALINRNVKSSQTTSFRKERITTYQTTHFDAFVSEDILHCRNLTTHKVIQHTCTTEQDKIYDVKKWRTKYL